MLFNFNLVSCDRGASIIGTCPTQYHVVPTHVCCWDVWLAGYGGCVDGDGGAVRAVTIYVPSFDSELIASASG